MGRRKREDRLLFCSNNNSSNRLLSAQAVCQACLGLVMSTMSSMRYLDSSNKNTTLANKLIKADTQDKRQDISTTMRLFSETMRQIFFSKSDITDKHSSDTPDIAHFVPCTYENRPKIK